MPTQNSSAPNASMSMSPSARTRLRQSEKVKAHYYNDMGKNSGNCTWGAGILVHHGVCSKDELATKVTLADINRVFDSKVAEAEAAVRRRVTKVSLKQDQFDALVSLTYNTGARGAKDTFVLANSGNFEGAADNFQKMIRVKVHKKGKIVDVVAPGLIKRRADESAPFRKSAKGAAK